MPIAINALDLRSLPSITPFSSTEKNLWGNRKSRRNINNAPITKPDAAIGNPEISIASDINSRKESVIMIPAAKPIRKPSSFLPGFLIRAISPPRPVAKPASTLRTKMSTMLPSMLLSPILPI